MMDRREQVKNLGVTIQNDIVLKIKFTPQLPPFKKEGCLRLPLVAAKL